MLGTERAMPLDELNGNNFSPPGKQAPNASMAILCLPYILSRMHMLLLGKGAFVPE